MKQYILNLIILVMILTGCTAQITTTNGPVNLQTNMDAVAAYYNGQYDKDVLKLSIEADIFIAKTLKSRQYNKPAIVFDVDDTLLNNYSFYQRNGFQFRRSLWEQWVNMANIPAIAPIQSLYAKYVDRVDIFIVTGRNVFQRSQTLRNLKGQGYDNWTGIFFKEEWDRKLTAKQYKTRIINQIQNTSDVQIIANFGDQESDFGSDIIGRSFRLPNLLYVTE
ncbi:HAD family acid phosphatase [Pseudodesulfovibrio sp. zrk46]|uniref:HAD family acid phosphatase n=1 Tax=Pseudodesulfovibrio sp. zrk46 TaxID=2725288 RepID=UPI00144917B6|nr:HAD family acid phosphatase [Pseudodesulfovibrio sp. zrk46]QJB57708.1 hypothetical protein HFN16_15405 [Pseudodesulfovibrio sp. zrk46]